MVNSITAQGIQKLISSPVLGTPGDGLLIEKELIQADFAL